MSHEVASSCFGLLGMSYSARWCFSDICWFITPWSVDISPINPGKLGDIFANLAIPNSPPFTKCVFCSTLGKSEVDLIKNLGEKLSIHWWTIVPMKIAITWVSSLIFSQVVCSLASFLQPKPGGPSKPSMTSRSIYAKYPQLHQQSPGVIHIPKLLDIPSGKLT